MYTHQEMLKAVKLYIQLNKRTALTIQTLGYPTKNTLRSWYKTYLQSGDLPQGYIRHKQVFTEQQKAEAIQHYVENGRCMAHTIRCLGYPCKETLRKWLYEKYPELYPSRKSITKKKRFSQKQKTQAVINLQTREKSAKRVATEVGVSRTTLYHWRDKLLTDKELYAMSKPSNDSKNTQLDELLKEKLELEKKIYQLRLEHDILLQTHELLKKDRGINPRKLTNREKTQLVDTLKTHYPLSILLPALMLARSSYFYHKARLRLGDKYADVREQIKKIFIENYECYGYRRITGALKNQQTVISEKVVRRLMAEANLKVIIHRKKRFNAYSGEISPAPENLLNRDFASKAPNEKWLTDITEIRIPAGKVYLSALVDCYDGLITSWSIGTSPNATLVNSMLKTAISTLNSKEKPMIHSDRGTHYRWPEWIKIVNQAGLVRSMSRKGCSPDNAACEGFFGRFKNEFLYHRDWSHVSIPEIIEQVDTYIHWYNKQRIKKSLGYRSPIKYRQDMGFIV